MKNLAATFIILASFQAVLAHGSLELIECHNSSNSLILRGEAINKENDFAFKMLKDNKEVWSHKKIRLVLKDTVEDKKLYENIEISDGKGHRADLKIEEIAIREVRPGTGLLNFPKLAEGVRLICYAVY